MRASDTGLSARRVGAARLVLLLAFAGLAARAVHLATLDRRGVDRALSQTRRTLTLAPERGLIADREGTELALSVDAPSVYAIPSALADAGSAARALAPVLGTDAGRLATRLRNRDGFLFLARWVSPERARRVRALDLPGVGVLQEPRRVYPHRGLAAQVLGFANIDGEGVRGIEQREDAWLRGAARRLPVERVAGGRLLLAGGEDWGSTGGSVALTLDATDQAQAEAALRDAVARTGALGGLVISLDPATGDVRALAEAPGFDPNRFRELPYPATRARSFLDALEPGSTFKAFLVAAALERAAIDSEELFDCGDGHLRVGGRTIRDHEPHGWLGPADVLRVSSNVCAVEIARRLGPEPHFDMLRRFGFGSSTRTFPDESAGLLRRASGWRPLDHANIAFGQGVSVTAIQLAVAMSALANGGVLVTPRLVAARRPPGGSWEPTRPRMRGRVLRRETADTVLRMLEGVVSADGTGRRAGLRGVRVAGKTGTAQKFDAEQGRYAENRFSAWFMGAVPADAPQRVLVVELDEPRRPLHTGGAAASPLFARVAAAQLSRLGLDTVPQPPAPAPRPAAPPDPAIAVAGGAAPGPPASGRPAPEFARDGDRVLLPDLTGLTVAQVKQITARQALELEISGSGRAVAQEPSPGTVLAGHRPRIRVRFSRGSGPRDEEI